MIVHNEMGFGYYPFKGTTITAAGLQADNLLIGFHLVLGLQIW
jgi:hypothetical protein